jgi:hypothetical protein
LLFVSGVGKQQRLFAFCLGVKMQIDTIKIQNGVMVWKQIERKKGLTFMRIKKSKKGVVLE